MQTASNPSLEVQRLARLKRLGALDTAPEPLHDPLYDQLAQAAASICDAPIALITLLDADRQWFIACIGLTDAGPSSHDMAFALHTIQSPHILEVEDAQADTRFAKHPFVQGPTGLRFYAGTPISMEHGERVGTLCIHDHLPRRLTSTQGRALQDLAQAVARSLQERESRHQLVHQLAASEENYRRVIEYQTELISLAEQDGKLVFVNEAYASYFGGKAEDMIGQSLFDYILEDDRELVRRHLKWDQEDVVRTNGVNRMVLPDGSVHWVAWTNRLLPAREGQPALIHSVGRDISAQKAAEDALRASEQRYRHLYESTPAMMHSIDRTGRLISVSDAWLAKLEYSREEVIGQPTFAFLSPESRQRSIDHELPAFFRTGRSKDVPYVYVTKSGKHINVLLSAVMEYTADGIPLRSMAVLQDVSDKHAAETQLKQSAHLLQLVMDNLPARISYWTKDHRNIFANPAFQRAFKCEGQQIAGKFTWEIMGQSWWDQIKHVVEIALTGKEQWLEVSSAGANGTRTDTELRFAPSLFEGQVQGVFVIALDITARRLAEELRHEQLVRKQLEHDAAELQRLLNERNEMLDVLAHEVRQPINNASAALQGAHRALASTGYKEGLGAISKAQSVLYDVQNSVNNILAVATQLSQPTEPMNADFDLDMLLSISIADMPTSEQSRIEVVKSTTIKTIHTDASLLRLALRNLLKNALDFSPTDASVTLAVSDGDKEDDLIIDVVDQGSGVDPDVLPRLFEKHVHGYRLGRVSHGLGLYIVRQAMTQLQGTVELLETGPSGTRMRLRLKDGLQGD